MKSKILKDVKLWIQEVPGNFHFVWYVGYASTIELKKQSDIYFKLIYLSIKNEQIKFMYDEDDIFRVGKEIVEKQQSNSSYTKSMISKWDKIVEKYYSICRVIEESDLKDLDDEEFKRLFKSFSQSYTKEYALPMLADALGYYSEIRIQELLKDYLGSKKKEKDFTNYLTLLTTPTEESFLTKEKEELLKIASRSKNGESIDKALKKHRDEWSWIQNNYSRAVDLDTKYFQDRIGQHISSKDPNVELKEMKQASTELLDKKDKLLGENKFSEEMIVMVDLLLGLPCS